MNRELTDLEKSIISNINKRFGKDNPLIQLGEDSEYGRVKSFVDTGIYSLNWLISGRLDGGYPVGRITEIDGDPGTGKSLLCEMAMADPSLDLIIYLDTEAAMNVEFLKFLGVNPSKVLYMPIDTVEQINIAAQEILDTIVMNKTNKKVLMIIDSIALATTEKEIDPDSGQDMGYKARLLRGFFRVYARKIEKHNIALLITNHYTQKIGVMYGSNKTTTGGTALSYAASVRLDLKVSDIDIDKKIESIGASAVTIRAKTEKNRIFSPKRSIKFVLDFDKGVDRYSGLFQILLDFGLAEKAGAWCKLPSWDKEKKFYLKDFSQIIKENNLLPHIQSLLDSIKGIDFSSEIEEISFIDEDIKKLNNKEARSQKREKLKSSIENVIENFKSNQEEE